jgi:hypothetical protein
MEDREKASPNPPAPSRTRKIGDQVFEICWDGRNRTALPSAPTANSSRRLAREIRFKKEAS